MGRKVLLDGKHYDIGDGIIQRRNINPRAARFETGVPGYSSFTQASVNALKGMRGGIGHKYQESSGTEECWWSEGVDASHHGGTILGPEVNTAGTEGVGEGLFGVAPVKIIDFGDYTYGIGHNKIARSSAETPAWSTVVDDFASPVDAIVVTDSTATYLIVSSATAAIYSTTGDEDDWTSLTNCMGHLAIHDNKLYGFSANTLYNSPARASDGTWDITGTWTYCKYMHYFGTVYGLFSAKSQATDQPLLCLHSSEALWTIDPWVQEAYKYLALTGHTYAGMAGMFWNSYIFVSSLGGIKKIAGNLVTDIGPDQNDGLPETYQGYVSDMCPAGDGSWMVFSVHNDSATDKSSIFKRHGTIGGNQQIYTSAADTAITCVHYSPSHMYTNGRLWWGEGTNIKYCMMPDFNTDVTEISGYKFTLSGDIIYSIHRPLEAFPKLAISVAGNTNACDEDNPITISYWTDNDDDWVELGTFEDTPPDALLFGDDDEGLEFRWIKLKASLEAKTSAASPELRSLELDYDAATERIRGWTFVVKVTRNEAETIITDLHTSQDKKTLLKFYPSGDSGKTSYQVKISAIAENIHWDTSEEEGELIVSVEELLRR